MKYASNGFIPPENIKHNPDLSDKDGNTVAMMLM